MGQAKGTMALGCYILPTGRQDTSEGTQEGYCTLVSSGLRPQLAMGCWHRASLLHHPLGSTQGSTARQRSRPGVPGDGERFGLSTSSLQATQWLNSFPAELASRAQAY